MRPLLLKGMHAMTYGSGLKSIGKAVTKGTKQVGKTLTNIAESPDKRGQGKLFLIQNPQFSRLRSSDKRTQGRSNVHVQLESGALGLDTGKIESRTVMLLSSNCIFCLNMSQYRGKYRSWEVVRD